MLWAFQKQHRKLVSDKSFFTREDVSRVNTGRRQTITRNILVDTTRNLHKKCLQKTLQGCYILHFHFRFLLGCAPLHVWWRNLHVQVEPPILYSAPLQWQAADFGFSPYQATLHTVVLYVGGDQEPTSSMISPSKNKGPPVIWEHLNPVLDCLQATHPEVSVIHLFSALQRVLNSVQTIRGQSWWGGTQWCWSSLVEDCRHAHKQRLKFWLSLCWFLKNCENWLNRNKMIQNISLM